MSLAGLPAAQLADRFRRGELSAVEIVNASLARVRAVDTRVGAFLRIDEAGALTAAASLDERRARGDTLGPLAAIPIALKDNICLTGRLATCGSRILENFRSPYDAHIVERLRQADAILIGQTNLDEFAMGSSCENSAFQKTRNPYDLERSPGGSSGGSAAAVAADMVPLSIGSDTGGSIRQPASFCGVVGMKPTYGRVSRYGLVAYASSLDQIGPFARDVRGAAILLQTLSGHDPRDSTSIKRDVPDYLPRLEQPLEGLKIGIVPEHFDAGLEDEVRAATEAAIGVYRKLGASIVEVELPHSKYGIAAYYVIAPCEASSNLARYDGVHYGHRAAEFDNMIDMYERSRGEAFGDEVKRRIMIGTYALSSGYYDAYYLKAHKVRQLIRRDYAEAFARVDVLLTPVAPTAAFKIGELADNPLAMYLSDLYTINANLAGIPGISVPCGYTQSGLPIGLQLLAPAFEEERLLRAARMYERETDWIRPPVLPAA